jgi:hypothetical protein
MSSSSLASAFSRRGPVLTTVEAAVISSPSSLATDVVDHRHAAEQPSKMQESSALAPRRLAPWYAKLTSPKA